jgi:hypothetical protein
MEEIIFCKEGMKTECLHHYLGLNGQDITGISCSNPSFLRAYTPYRVGLKSPYIGGCVLTQLTPAHISRSLTDLSISLGEDNVIALADMFAILQKYGLGVVGSSTTVYSDRIKTFVKAVEKYQAALMEYRQVAKASPAAKRLAEQKARTAFKDLQVRFRHSLASVTKHSKSRKGTPLTSVQRALNLARDNRRITKLNITSHVQANNLVMLSKNMKLLGNGLAFIDLGSRVGNIHNSYQAGENWERELFIESISFASSATAGIHIINTGSAALTLLVAATPITWVGLIFCGIVVACVAAATSMAIDTQLKKHGGSLYDKIMPGVGTL